MEEKRSAKFTGKEIRRRRKALNMTQEELAERVFTTQDAISRIERGQQDPPFQFLCAIAKEICCTPNDLTAPEMGFEILVDVRQEQFDAIMSILMNGNQEDDT